MKPIYFKAIYKDSIVTLSRSAVSGLKIMRLTSLLDTFFWGLKAITIGWFMTMRLRIDGFFYVIILLYTVMLMHKIPLEM